jgi:hypothetical protein
MSVWRGVTFLLVAVLILDTMTASFQQTGDVVVSTASAVEGSMPEDS